MLKNDSPIAKSALIEPQRNIGTEKKRETVDRVTVKRRVFEQVGFAAGQLELEISCESELFVQFLLPASFGNLADLGKI